VFWALLTPSLSIWNLFRGCGIKKEYHSSGVIYGEWSWGGSNAGSQWCCWSCKQCFIC
jgi:hypothetical protein